MTTLDPLLLECEQIVSSYRDMLFAAESIGGKPSSLPADIQEEIDELDVIIRELRDRIDQGKRLYASVPAALPPAPEPEPAPQPVVVPVATPRLSVNMEAAALLRQLHDSLSAVRIAFLRKAAPAKACLSVWAAMEMLEEAIGHLGTGGDQR